MLAPQISEKTRETIRSFLQSNLAGKGGKTFFRRVKGLIGNELQSIAKIQNPDLPIEYIDSVSLSNLSKENLYKHVQITYKSFYGFTKKQSIRDEPSEVVDKSISFHSKNYSQLDLSVDMTFDFSGDKKLTKPNTPMLGDLIFIYMSDQTLKEITEEKNPKKYPKADKWFIASDQFLRAYTLIMEDWNETFNFMIPHETPRHLLETTLKSKLFCGNKLMTNTWYKNKLELESVGKIMTTDESTKKYWVIRSEYVSKRWIDVWAALVLISRYGELPCSYNVPNTKIGPNRLKWDIPDNLVSSLIKKALNITEIPIEIIDENIPEKIPKYKNVSFIDLIASEKAPNKNTEKPVKDVILNKNSIEFIKNTHPSDTLLVDTPSINTTVVDTSSNSSWASKVKSNIVISIEKANKDFKIEVKIG